MQHYLARLVLLNRPTNRDFERLPQRSLYASRTPQPWPDATKSTDLGALPVVPRRGEAAVELSTLLAESGTTALVVLRDGRLVWESYPNGGSRGRMNCCFSVTKSLASALVGVALGDQAIAALQAPIGRWLPELRDPRVAALTIEHLLEMRSGIRYTEGYWPWRDEPRVYYANDLRRRALDCRVTDPVGAFFHYNDWHPILLALLIERASGLRITDLVQQSLWDPLGCEHDASLAVDRADAAGLEHLEAGLNARALDLARFGQLVLQGGVWNGRRLLPEGWVEAMTTPVGARTDAAWYAHYQGRPWGRFLASGRVDYRRLWWGVRIDEERRDVFAMGVLGQHVYLSPDLGTVVVRMSDRFPPGLWWAPLLRRIAEAAAGEARSASPASPA